MPNFYDYDELPALLEKSIVGDRLTYMTDNQQGTIYYEVVIDENGNKNVIKIGDYDNEPMEGGRRRRTNKKRRRTNKRKSRRRTNKRKSRRSTNKRR
jgi:hypothetical protein